MARHIFHSFGIPQFVFGVEDNIGLGERKELLGSLRLLKATNRSWATDAFIHGCKIDRISIRSSATIRAYSHIFAEFKR